MIDVRIDRLWSKDSFGIWIFDRDLQNKVTNIAKPVELTFELSKDGWNLPEPTIEIRRDISQPLFQALINEFVRHGMHADNDKVAGQLESQTKHLEDMRRLVFNRIPDGNL